VLYVASAVKQQNGWDVEVIDEANWASAVSKSALRSDPAADHRALQMRRPAQAVGFYGGLTSTIPRLLEVAEFYHGMGIRTVAGGAHCDAIPEEPLRSGIDVVVHGEGEETILEILNAWTNRTGVSEIRGISYVGLSGNVIRTADRPPICDLDKLPTPDFDLLVELRHRLTIAPFERTRGCNFSCEFCVVSDRFGPSRSASPERVAAEVEMRLKNGFRTFFCVDDNFTQGHEKTMKLLSMLKELRSRNHNKFDITVQVRSSVGRDPELMRAMRAAGIQILAIGLESPISEELQGMEKHQTPEQIERDIRSLRKNGFMIHGMFIFGYPVENDPSIPQLTLRERADRFYAFIRHTALDTVQILKPVPIPGSRLAERLRSQGRIFPLKSVGWDKYDGNFLCFLPDGVSAKELQEQATRILRRFYSPMNFFRFPVLVFTTPVEIIRLWIERAREIRRDPVSCAQAAVAGVRKTPWAIRAGLAQAAGEIGRVWKTAAFRSLGSIVVAKWMHKARQRDFVQIIQRCQKLAARRDLTAVE
jgi:radical SAM superfamily enzyme YgiQ (UPF0313 family)